MYSITTLLSDIEVAIQNNPNIKVEFVTKVMRDIADGDAIERVVHGNNIIECFPRNDHSVLTVCVQSGDMQDVQHRYIELHTKLKNFLENTTELIFNQLKTTRQSVLPQKILTSVTEPKVLLSEFAEQLRLIINKNNDGCCEPTLDCSFDIDSGHYYLDTLSIRVFADVLICSKVDQTRNVFSIEFAPSLDNYDLIKQVSDIEMIVDRLESTKTKNGAFNKRTLNQATKIYNNSKPSGRKFAHLDDHARTEFVCGGCYSLALVLHQITGYPIYAEIDGDEFIHCWIKNPDGNAIDINGIHDGNWAKTPYSQSSPKGVIQEYQGNNDLVDPDMIEWARDLVFSHLEHFNLSY
ncbi:hypothetical protein [Photobacterium damselae]|uniref:hypothetical protein n=1 Tax=Photobacterium damselae TaxID=38293 RepID=UPI004067F4AF